MSGRVRNYAATLTALEAALGQPLVDPYRDRRLVMCRWICPACGAGTDDPLGLWRPLVLRGDGALWCDVCSASPQEIKQALERTDEVALWRDIALDARDLAERLGGQLVAALAEHEAAVDVEVAAVEASLGAVS